jgi:hypothetical protein
MLMGGNGKEEDREGEGEREREREREGDVRVEEDMQTTESRYDRVQGQRGWSVGRYPTTLPAR